MVKIGVAGYSAQKFDEDEALRLLTEAYNTIEKEYTDEQKEVISGLTDLGIPALAYREAVNRSWKTVGIACSKARKYACFPVDEEIIVGDEWGDESQTFLDTIDILVRVGGGKQAHSEASKAKERGKRTLEYELNTI